MAVFVRVVDAGSFAGAADGLQISATMVGKHIRFLEARLGVVLISRTTRRQSLTEAGRIYYGHCRAILADIATAEAATAEHLAVPRGRLRITMPILLGRYCVAPLLLQAVADFPDLKLDLVFTDTLLDLNDCDLSIRSLASSRGEMPAPAGLAMRRLCSHNMVVCGAPSYIERHPRPIAWADLPNHATIAFTRDGHRLPWTFTAADGALTDVETTGRIAMDDLEVIADTAAAGHGVAWLPSWLVRERVEKGLLVELPMERPGMGYDNYALWHEGLMTPKVRLALDTLIAKLPALM